MSEIEPHPGSDGDGASIWRGERADAAALSERLFRIQAETLPHHVWTASPDGLLLWYSSKVYAYTGLKPGALNGDAWTTMVHPEDRPRAIASWETTIRTGVGQVTEFRLRRYDGDWRWHISRAAPLFDDHGQIVRWIGSNTDIHAQKLAEASVTQMNAELEERVEARTRELMETREILRHSQKMELIGNLAGGIAHDLNNLLQIISGSLQLFHKTVSVPPSSERYLRSAVDAVVRGGRLTSQLLAMGRRQALQPEPVHAGQMLSNMGEMLQRTLGPLVEVVTEVAPDLWITRIDVGNLENAVLNLAINARDAMRGQGQLRVLARNATLNARQVTRMPGLAAGDYVVIIVKDRGEGMNDAVLERVFEPFFTTKEEGKGTGLGLPMVYGFARQSGGHVQIQSAPGYGTTVSLYLPRAPAQDLPATPRAPEALVGGSETILLVEDDAAVRESVMQLLRDLGYKVLMTDDAQSALAMVMGGVPVDLVFVDVVMPGALSSIKLAQLVQQDRPQVPVLYTSGYIDPANTPGDTLSWASRPGAAATAFIRKPYLQAELASKLRQLLDPAPS